MTAAETRDDVATEVLEDGAEADTSAVEPPRRRRFRTFDSLIDVPAFRWYLLSMTGNWSALQMQQVARGYLAYHITGSFAALGFIEFSNTVPRMIFGMYGGVLADRISRRVIIQVGQAVNAVNVGIVALLLFTGQLQFYHLILMTFVQGVINSFVLPARQAMIPEIVGPDRIMNALALNVFVLNVIRSSSYAAAGALIAFIVAQTDDVFVAVGVVFTIMALLYVLAVMGLFPVPRTNARTRAAVLAAAGQPEQAPDRAGFSEMFAGFAYLRRHTLIIWLIAIQTSTAMLALPYQRLLPGFVEEVLGGGNEGESAAVIGLLLTMTAIGAIIGSLIVASLPERHRGIILAASLVLFGITLIFFSLSTVLILSIVIVIALGIGQAIRQSMVNILIQSRIEDMYRGRVSAVMLLDDALESLGVFAVAMLADAFGPQTALGITGVVMACFGLVMYMTRTFRNLD